MTLGRCVCRRLGERENEDVGSSSISLLDLWQLNGSEVTEMENLNGLDSSLREVLVESLYYVDVRIYSNSTIYLY